MIGRLSAAVAGSVERRKATWVITALVVCAGGVWTSARLGFRLDIGDFLPQQGASGGLPSEVLQQLSGSGRLAVVFESGDSIETSDVERLFSYLTPRLAGLPGVRSVDSRLSSELRRFADQELPARIALYLEPGVLQATADRLSRASIEAALLEGEPPTAPLRSAAQEEADPLGLLRLAAQGVRGWQGVSRVRLIDDYYALPGGRAFFLSLETALPLDDIAAARAMVGSVSSVLSSARADADIGRVVADRLLYPVGRAVSYTAAVDLLSADGLRVSAAAATVALLLLALFFRRVAAPLAIFLTVGSGVAITGAVAWSLFGSVSLFTWVFLGLLVGLGVDYGIHIVVHYWVYGDAASRRSEGLASALARPGVGIVLGSATSIAAFLSLLVVPYPWMTELAVLTAVGLLAILICSFTVLPLLLSFSRPRATAQGPFPRWTTWLDRSTERSPLRAGAPWALLVLASVLALPGLRFEPHPWNLALRGNPESARLDRLNREAGTAFTPLLIVSAGETADEAIALDRDAVQRLRRVELRAGIASIQSLARWLPSPEVQRANIQFIRERPELFSRERFSEDFMAVVADMERPTSYLTQEYLPAILPSLDPDVEELTLGDLRGLGLGAEIDRHLIQLGDTYTAVSYVFLRRFPWAEGATSDFLEVARGAGLEDLPGVTLAGGALRSAGHTQVIRRAVLFATILATMLVGGLLALRFRRLSLVVLCLAPLVCGLSATVLAMRLLGVELTLLSIAIAPILVGIGVDDGIHMVERLDRGQDVGTVLREAGAAITMTTLTTVGGFAALALATFTGVREVGLIGAIGLLSCLLASVHLIPLGWRLMEGRRSN